MKAVPRKRHGDSHADNIFSVLPCQSANRAPLGPVLDVRTPDAATLAKTIAILNDAVELHRFGSKSSHRIAVNAAESSMHVSGVLRRNHTNTCLLVF